MKKVFETQKLYYGFPIFFLGYKDEKWGYNLTTSSSSYTLGEMLVIGIFSGGNACRQIQKHGSFSLNLPLETHMLEIEQAGFHSGRDKFSLTNLTYQGGLTLDVPLIDDCPLVLECQVEEMIEFDNYTNFIARIIHRHVDEKLVADGKFQSKAFNPILYMGDGKERIYRYLEEERSDKMGSVLKAARKNQRKSRQ